MKAEDIYQLGPDAVTTEMIEAAREALRKVLGREPTFQEADHFFEPMLDIAKQYYRLGAFNMEHRDGTKCEAEDQGGWPCCGQPAEFFVKPEHADGRRIVYCSDHQDNRFFSPHHMAPIYESPKEKT